MVAVAVPVQLAETSAPSAGSDVARSESLPEVEVEVAVEVEVVVTCCTSVVTMSSRVPTLIASLVSVSSPVVLVVVEVEVVTCFSTVTTSTNSPVATGTASLVSSPVVLVTVTVDGII